MFVRRMKIRAALAAIALLAGGSQLALAQGAAERPQPSLYDRLGGLAPIAVVVSDFIDGLMPDTVLNANPAINAARRRVPAAYLKYHVTALVCQATGGPCPYHGRGMRESHVNLHITAREWDRMIVILTGVLAKHRVPTQEAEELLRIVGSTRTDIVGSPTGR